MKKNEPKKIDYFDDTNKHRVVSDFAVAYYSKRIKVDTKDAFNEIYWFSEEELRVKDRLSYINTKGQALGFKSWQIFQTPDNSQYFIVPEDQYYRQVEELCDRYSGVIEVPESERQFVEKKLYEMIMKLMKQGRIDGKFELQPYRDLELQKLASSMERLTRLIEVLERRVSSLEKLAEKIPR